MPFPIYEDVNNLVAAVFIRRAQRVFVNVSVWEHCALDRFFWVAKFTAL
jgi:hypothetical protein